MAASRAKVAHIVHITHRDQVEAPIIDWLREAYDVTDTLRAKPARKAPTARKKARTSSR